MKIHLVSDLHLEMSKDYPTYLLKVDCNVLILAGDIGAPFTSKYKNFINLCSDTFEHVILVAGNHEYYNKKHTIDEINKQIELVVSEYSNVYFLQQKSVIIDNVRFVGCTLWSNPLNDVGLTNDFTRINGLDEIKYKQLHYSDRVWLTNVLQDKYEGKTVVVTHYVPSFQLLDSKYTDIIMNSYYASNLESLMEKVSYWFCGHTHTSVNKIINNCNCVINPYGYPFEIDTGFCNKLVIKI